MMNSELEKSRKENFFCYSYPLYHFLRLKGIDYKSKGRNKNNNLNYFVFEKNEKLYSALNDWNKWKENNPKSKEMV